MSLTEEFSGGTFMMHSKLSCAVLFGCRSAGVCTHKVLVFKKKKKKRWDVVNLVVQGGYLCVLWESVCLSNRPQAI